MNPNDPLFQDPQKDQQIKTKCLPVYSKTQVDRFNRYADARAEVINLSYPTHPLMTETELPDFCAKLKAQNSVKYPEFQQKLDNGEYARPNTPEWQYMQDYRNALNNFAWPDANEQQIRTAEEAELEKLL